MAVRTAKQQAALKKAQAASARKRKGTGKSKRKVRGRLKTTKTDYAFATGAALGLAATGAGMAYYFGYHAPKQREKLHFKHHANNIRRRVDRRGGRNALYDHKGGKSSLVWGDGSMSPIGRRRRRRSKGK